MKLFLLRATPLVVALFFLSCGTIIHGSRQDVSINSVPTGASVSVDGVPSGVTPVSVEMKRKDKHTVKIELDGYAPYEMNLNRKVSGWVWGNIVFGGVIGLAVDAISGGLYKIEPDLVNAQLTSQGTSATEGEMLYLTVVLKPDSGWEKIGQLTLR